MKNNIYKKSYGLIEANLNILLNSDMSSLVILSPAGLGKTTLTFKTMERLGYKQGEHFVYYNSHFTPLGFYNVLGETCALKKPKLLILDDVELMLQNKTLINLLKSATWENESHKRVVNFVSTSTKVKSDKVDFDGKIVLLLNEIPEANPMLNAIIDRSLYTELNFTNAEIIELMEQEIVNKPYQKLSIEQRKKILAFVKKNIQPSTELSFRTLIKAYNNYLFAPNHWKELTIQSLKSRKEVVANSSPSLV